MLHQRESKTVKERQSAPRNGHLLQRGSRSGKNNEERQSTPRSANLRQVMLKSAKERSETTKTLKSAKECQKTVKRRAIVRQFAPIYATKERQETGKKRKGWQVPGIFHQTLFWKWTQVRKNG